MAIHSPIQFYNAPLKSIVCPPIRSFCRSPPSYRFSLSKIAKNGISKRFLNYFQTLDLKLGTHVVGPDKTISGKVQEALTDAQARAKELDEQKGISKTAESVCILYSLIFMLFSERRFLTTLILVLSTSSSAPSWQESVRRFEPFVYSSLNDSFRFDFYTNTAKQVVDIHEEARRIANHRQSQAPGPGNTQTVPQPQPPVV